MNRGWRACAERGLPTFLVIGAAKAGTTSLYRYLEQHPQIFVSPVKEPRFFALEGEVLDFRGPGDERLRRDTTTSLAAYRALFSGVRDERASGEASTLYLHHPRAAANVAKHVPDVQLIALLRNPIERAYSAFLHRTRDGFEPCRTFEDALRDEPRRIAAGWAYGWHYRDQGFYQRDLSRYFERFDRSQIRIHLHEDLDRDPLAVVTDLFGWLGVDPSFRPDVRVRHNPSGRGRHPSAQRLLASSHPLKRMAKTMIPDQWGHRAIAWLQARTLARPELRPDTRAELRECYREDIGRLAELIGRDLSSWLR